MFNTVTFLLLMDEMLSPSQKFISWEDVMLFLQDEVKVFVVLQYALDKGYKPEYIEEYTQKMSKMGYSNLVEEVKDAYTQLQL